MTKSWDEHYEIWKEMRHRPEQDPQQRAAVRQHRLKDARKRVAENTPDDWLWLEEGLSDPDKKWFVADVFKFQPVAKRLYSAMLLAGVLEQNPSANQWFIKPCVRSFGARRVLEDLLRYLEAGSNAEKAGATSARYWVVENPRNEKLDDILQRIHHQELREFVDNDDLEVRRRIIPRLKLESRHYPKELRPLVPIAIKTARSHPDEYVRHRAEIQLGAGGLFMPIPDTGRTGDANNLERHWLSSIWRWIIG